MKELPTLEKEIRDLKAKVAAVEKRVAWLEASVGVQARERPSVQGPTHAD